MSISAILYLLIFNSTMMAMWTIFSDSHWGNEVTSLTREANVGTWYKSESWNLDNRQLGGRTGNGKSHDLNPFDYFKVRWWWTLPFFIIWLMATGSWSASPFFLPYAMRFRVITLGFAILVINVLGGPPHTNPQKHKSLSWPLSYNNSPRMGGRLTIVFFCSR